MVLIFTRADTSKVTVEGIDALIRKEIPIGSSKEQVYEFLDRHQLSSTAYDVGPDPLFGLRRDEREMKRYVTATIFENPDPARSKYHIHVVFYFDEELKLIDYKMEQLDDVP